MGCMRVPLIAESSLPIPNTFWPGFSWGFLIFVRPGSYQRVLAESRELDKQSLLPKKELRLLTNLRLLPPSSPYSLASSTNQLRKIK